MLGISVNINHVLPPEVFNAIFNQLSKSDNKTCMFVCTTWYFPAKRTFYRHTTIEGESVIKRFLICLKESNIGIYIQHLKISDLPNRSRTMKRSIYNPNDLFVLFDKCINLLVLEVSRMNPYYILRSLVRNSNQLVRLEEIVVVWCTCFKISSAVKRAYFLANQAHKNSIRRIRLPSVISSRSWPQEIKRSSDYFSSFPQLEKYSYE